MANEEARARAGATFMDVTAVGWPEKIDADTLDLSSCDKCVFGQAFDDHYLCARAKLGLTARQCASLGFCSEVSLEHNHETWATLTPEVKSAYREQVSAEYRLLNAAWLTEIALRLGTPEAEEARIEASPVDVGEAWGAL